MLENPRFIQGVFSFEGRGLERAEPLRPEIVYQAPRDRRVQLIYFRGGNSTSELVYLVLRQNERPLRYFPLAPNPRSTCRSPSSRTSRLNRGSTC